MKISSPIENTSHTHIYDNTNYLSNNLSQIKKLSIFFAFNKSNFKSEITQTHTSIQLINLTDKRAIFKSTFFDTNLVSKIYYHSLEKNDLFKLLTILN